MSRIFKLLAMFSKSAKPVRAKVSRVSKNSKGKSLDDTTLKPSTSKLSLFEQLENKVIKSSVKKNTIRVSKKKIENDTELTFINISDNELDDEKEPKKQLRKSTRKTVKKLIINDEDTEEDNEKNNKEDEDKTLILTPVKNKSKSKSKKEEITKAPRKSKKAVSLSDDNSYNINKIIDEIHEYLNNGKFNNIKLLKDKEVLKWIFNDKEFVSTLNGSDETETEKYWGNKKMDTVDNKQWTTLFGQNLVKELYDIKGINLLQPEIKDNKKPDWIWKDEIIEVKTRTYHTKGTAGEKILGTPIKYADLLDLYNRPVLNIICVGYQECEAVKNFKLFENKCDDLDKLTRKEKILYCINSLGIHYLKFTELLIDFVNKSKLTK